MRHKKRTDKLSVCQQSLYCVKNARNTLSGKHCQSLSFSLSLSLSIYICKKGLDPDQTRMDFRKECFVNLKICACDRKYTKCCTNADAHDVYLNKYIHCRVPCTDPEGGQGVRTPTLKKHKNVEFLSITGPDPLKFSKILKATKPAFSVGLSSACHLNVFFAGGPMMPAYNSDIWILSPIKKRRKTLSELQSWTPSGKTFWIRAWVPIGSSCNKIDWSIQNIVFRDSKKPSQNKRFVCISLSLFQSL